MRSDLTGRCRRESEVEVFSEPDCRRGRGAVAFDSSFTALTYAVRSSMSQTRRDAHDETSRAHQETDVRIAALLVLVMATSASSQTFHLVGPGGHAQIRDALAVAAQGDVIEVQPGFYAQFGVYAGVTIRALVPGSVLVSTNLSYVQFACFPTPFCPQSTAETTVSCPPGQNVYISGLSFVPYDQAVPPTFITLRHRVVVYSGAVSFEDCQFAASSVPALNVNGAVVHLQNCNVLCTGGASQNPGAAFYFSKVTAVDTLFGGYSGGPSPGVPAGALLDLGSKLKASGCTFQGAVPLFGGGAGPGLAVDSLSSVWLRDSIVNGGGSACPLLGTPLVGRAQNTTFSPTLGCPTLPVGPVVGAHRSGPPVGGSPFAVTFSTAPFENVALFASLGLSTFTEMPGVVEQPYVGDPTLLLLGLYSADAFGDFTASFQIPEVILNGVPLWFGAATFGTSPLIQIAPELGGVVR